MQKLLVELKNPPIDTPQVYCSGSSGLNRPQRVSVQNKVLVNNNPLVKYNNLILQVKGTHCLGTRVLLENKKSVKISDVELYKYMRGWQFISILKKRVSLPEIL